MNADEIVRALRWLGEETEFIFAACNGKIKTAGGYKWRYAD